MDFTITDEQDGLRRSVREVLAKECPRDLVRRVVEEGTGADQLWATMVELGWPALAIPERHGGLGFGPVELVLVLEELGRAVAPGPFTATVSQFGALVSEAGSEEQRDRWLGAIAEGRITGALAALGRHGHLGPDHVTGTAKPDGDQWVLDGEAPYVLDGAHADEVAVAVRVPGADDGIGLFVVSGEQLDRRPVEALDATRGLGALTLSGVRVDADRVLGTPGEGAAPLQRALEAATVAVAAETVGTCQSILDETVGYAEVREQFGVPIGTFQAVKHQLADAYVALEQARSTTLFAAMCLAEDDQRRSMAAAMAKVAAGEAQRVIAHHGIQLHGGIGYTWEHDVQLLVKRAKAGDALLGTAAEHRARVADLLDI